MVQLLQQLLLLIVVIVGATETAILVSIVAIVNAIVAFVGVPSVFRKLASMTVI